MSIQKSTLQNEILGDLQKELGKLEVEKPEELPLKELATGISAGFSGSLGKHTSALVSKLISGKMPGGFGMGQVGFAFRFFGFTSSHSLSFFRSSLILVSTDWVPTGPTVSCSMG